MKTESNQKQLIRPLVSIIVITYNSAKFVYETLESAKSQTYSNIELIISDDCSKDETVELCQRWLEDNKQQFVRTEIITVEQNTGVSGNCNRGLNQAKGDWIKIIAGDDVLLNNCIEDNIIFVTKNQHIQAAHSNLAYYKEVFLPDALIKVTNKRTTFFNSAKITPIGQFKALALVGVFVHAPTLFLSRRAFSNVGMFDERMMLIEDFPFYLKLTSKNIKIHFLDSITVNYRVNNSSIMSIARKGMLQNQKVLERSIRLREYVLPHLNPFEKILAYLLHNIQKIALSQDKPCILLLGLNKSVQAFSYLYLNAFKIV